MKYLFGIALTVLLAFGGNAQDYTIEFDQEMETEDSTMLETLQMMGDMSSTWYISGKRFRGETNAGMTGTTTIIYNEDSTKMLMLMSNPFLGNKYTILQDTLDNDSESEMTVEKTKEKKKIAGYQCVKYVVTNASGDKTILYVTDKIKNPYRSQYNGKIEGTVLCSITESEIMGSKMKVVMTATSVKIKTIPNEKFSLDIPDGYTEFSVDDY